MPLHSKPSTKVFDSGASCNMFNNLSDFIKPLDNTIDTILTANNNPIYSKGKGLTVSFGEALYVPDLYQSLISTSADDKSGNYTIFGNSKVHFLIKPLF